MMSRPRLLSLVLLLGVLGSACGASTPAPQVVQPPPPLVPGALLFELASAQIESLRRPEGSPEELNAAIRSSRGAERREPLYQSALFHLFEAEAAEEGSRQPHYRAALQVAQRAVRRRQTETFDRDLAFLILWCSWREGRQATPGLVTRFHRDYGDQGELASIVWAILGEFEADQERWDEALNAWLNLIGDSRDPLYAYSLLRTGQVNRRAERSRQANRAFRQLRGYGCHEDSPQVVADFAALAAVELGDELQTGPRGRPVPAICAASGGDDEEE